MFEIKFIPHSKVTTKQLLEIISVKDIAWPHSLDSQFKWFADNLVESDIHVLLTKNSYTVAYLNLIDIKFKIDGNSIEGYGIGNVCSRERGKGWGKEIMALTNLYLIQKSRSGLLFCRIHTVNFYKLNNWILVDKSNLILPFNNELIETMIFNCDNRFQQLEYVGKSF